MQPTSVPIASWHRDQTVVWGDSLRRQGTLRDRLMFKVVWCFCYWVKQEWFILSRSGIVVACAIDIKLCVYDTRSVCKVQV